MALYISYIHRFVYIESIMIIFACYIEKIIINTQPQTQVGCRRVPNLQPPDPRRVPNLYPSPQIPSSFPPSSLGVHECLEPGGVPGQPPAPRFPSDRGIPACSGAASPSTFNPRRRCEGAASPEAAAYLAYLRPPRRRRGPHRELPPSPAAFPPPSSPHGDATAVGTPPVAGDAGVPVATSSWDAPGVGEGGRRRQGAGVGAHFCFLFPRS